LRNRRLPASSVAARCREPARAPWPLRRPWRTIRSRNSALPPPAAIRATSSRPCHARRLSLTAGAGAGAMADISIALETVATGRQFEVAAVQTRYCLLGPHSQLGRLPSLATRTARQRAPGMPLEPGGQNVVGHGYGRARPGAPSAGVAPDCHVRAARRGAPRDSAAAAQLVAGRAAPRRPAWRARQPVSPRRAPATLAHRRRSAPAPSVFSAPPRASRTRRSARSRRMSASSRVCARTRAAAPAGHPACDAATAPAFGPWDMSLARYASSSPAATSRSRATPAARVSVRSASRQRAVAFRLVAGPARAVPCAAAGRRCAIRG